MPVANGLHSRNRIRPVFVLVDATVSTHYLHAMPALLADSLLAVDVPRRSAQIGCGLTERWQGAAGAGASPALNLQSP